MRPPRPAAAIRWPTACSASGPTIREAGPIWASTAIVILVPEPDKNNIQIADLIMGWLGPATEVAAKK
jgi:hypothetical protein